MARQPGSEAKERRELTVRRWDKVLSSLLPSSLPPGAGDAMTSRSECHVENTALDVTACVQIQLVHLRIAWSQVSNGFSLQCPHDKMKTVFLLLRLGFKDQTQGELTLHLLSFLSLTPPENLYQLEVQESNPPNGKRHGWKKRSQLCFLQGGQWLRRREKPI